MQGDAPARTLYVPRVHAMHGPASGPVYPLLHRHSNATTLPSREFEFVAQGKQSLPDVAPVVPR